MKRHLISIVILVLSVNCAYADDKQIIAGIFRTDPKYLVVNLPPRPDTWPGAIFTSDLRFPIEYGNISDASLHRGRPIGIDSDDGFDLSAGAGVELPGLFGISASATKDADIKLYFPDARIVDMSRHDLIDHINKSQDAMEAVRAGQKPIIVVRSYSGTPTITVTRKAGASASGWDALRSLLTLKATASAEANNSVTFRGKDEIVFAFETAEIVDKLTAGGSPDGEIEINSLPETTIATRESVSENNFLVKGFSICVGDICGSSAKFNFNCDFAYAHPSDTDDAATKNVCIIQNTYTDYRFSRTLSVGGGRCGEIILSARCSNR
jgi:hypothetical protein